MGKRRERARKKKRTDYAVRQQRARDAAQPHSLLHRIARQASRGFRWLFHRVYRWASAVALGLALARLWAAAPDVSANPIDPGDTTRHGFLVRNSDLIEFYDVTGVCRFDKFTYSRGMVSNITVQNMDVHYGRQPGTLLPHQSGPLDCPMHVGSFNDLGELRITLEWKMLFGIIPRSRAYGFKMAKSTTGEAMWLPSSN